MVVEENESNGGFCDCICAPIYWFKMLAMELHWSFVFGVVAVYGISQGLGGALARVGTEYYMKDVQKVQPSEAQIYAGITSIPWLVKPLWGLLTDVLPIVGYHRRPYFILADMRLKKQKRHRKIVRFYTACFGFRQPFKVLCDGTFIHHLLLNHITPPDNAVSTILGAPVKLMTTKCVLAELKSLGDSYSESLKAAGKLITARCDHERRTSAEACFIEIIGENNPEHFFVATQDTDLRKKFQEIPGVPVIFGLRNALLLEPPSASQRQFVKLSEEERLHMTELEHKLLSKRQKNRLTTKETKDSSDENEAVEDQNLGLQAATNANNAKRRMIVKDGVQFKRNKAKGPNPLSCKKKKSQRQPNVALEKEDKDGSKTVRNSRKRKRSRKGKMLPGTDG